MKRIRSAARSRLVLARWRVIDVLGDVRRRVGHEDVALTFDDGPHPHWTPQVLEVLRRHDVRATFFCVGDNARRHPELLRRIADEGHAIGSHSATHRTGRGVHARALREFTLGRRAVEEALGRPTTLFRPPHGRLGLLTSVLSRAFGLEIWLWTVDAADWVPNTSADTLVRRFTEQVRGGDVLLMHDWIEEPISTDAYDRSALLEALPQVIERLRARGLRFARLR